MGGEGAAWASGIVVGLVVWGVGGGARALVVRARPDPRPAQSQGRRAGRRERSAPEAEVPVVVVLALLEAATQAGAALPRALQVVGRAVGDPTLERVGGALTLGARWDAAWEGVRGRVVADALRDAWTSGAAPSGALASAGSRLRRGAAARAKVAAQRLGVQLVLPLGLCLLPAFVLVGLVPVLLSLGVGLLG